MSTALKPVRDCGPEFGRRYERGLRADLRTADREAVRHFSARMIEIGRDCDRFDRANAIQAECDRLLALSPLPESEDIMALDVPIAPAIRPHFAPHPLHEAEPARAARPAASVRPALAVFLRKAMCAGRRWVSTVATSARGRMTAASGVAVDLIAGAAMGAFVLALLIWSAVLTGRL